MGEEVRLRFRYRPAEYTAALRYWERRTMRVTVDVALGALALAWGAWTWAREGSSPASVTAVVLGGLLLGIVFVGFVVMPPLWFRQQPKMRDEYDLTFGEEGIHFKTASIDSRLEWNLYTNVWEYPGGYLLFYGKRAFTIVPRRVFESARQEALFREMLTRHVRPLRPAQ